MGWTSKYLGAIRTVSLGSLTLTGANETIQVASPNAIPVGVLQDARAFASSYVMPLTQYIAPGEVWRPLGVNFIYTTSTTVTAPAVTLRKNATSAATGGVATGSIQTAPFSEFKPFTKYTFAADDVAGDKWSVLVTTTATAGVATIYLHYVAVAVAGISEAVATI